MKSFTGYISKCVECVFFIVKVFLTVSKTNRSVLCSTRAHFTLIVTNSSVTFLRAVLNEISFRIWGKVLMYFCYDFLRYSANVVIHL